MYKLVVFNNKKLMNVSKNYKEKGVGFLLSDSF